MRGGALGPFLVAVFSLVAGGPPRLPGQDRTPPPPPRIAQEPDLPIEDLVALFNRTRALDQEGELDRKTGKAVIYYSGGVEGTFPWRRPDGAVDQVRLMADRVLVLTEALERKGLPGERPRFGRPRLYAEGNVRLESRGVSIETDAFLYDAATRRGVAVRARGRGGIGELSDLARIKGMADRGDFSLRESVLGTGPDPGDGAAGPLAEPGGPGTPPRETARVLAFRAETLRVLGPDRFEGEGLVISSCEYGVPHLAVRSGAASVTPAPDSGGAGAGGDRDAQGGEEDRFPDYIVDARRNRLEALGIPVLPLPPLSWNTAWVEDLPIRGVQTGQSSKWGARLDVDWNLNWAFLRTPLARLDPVRLFLSDRDNRLGFVTDYRSKRGFGLGPEAIYGEDPRRWDPWELRPDASTYHGQAGYYAIRDEADEDRFGDVPIEDPDRHWAHLNHRQAIPHVGIVDIEYSKRSDENFLNEYFERIAKNEKEQESLVYFRRHLRDNLAVTGLYKYRTDDFETVVERIPEGKLFLMEQPVDRTGLYTGLLLQGANLRQRPADALPVDSSVRTGRLDALNEWSYPFGLGRLVRFRPFADLRGTVYGEGADPAEGTVDRAVFGAGVTATQEYWRIFRLERGGLLDRWFGARQMKHVVVPRVTYRNVFSNDEEPSDLLSFDEVDTITTDERVELSLRTHLLLRAPGEPTPGKSVVQPLPPADGRPHPYDMAPVPGPTRSLVEFEASADWFLRPARDNAGERFSFLDLDLVFRPARGLWLHSRTFLDPNDGLTFEQTDSALSLAAIPGMRLTVGERFTRDLTALTYGIVGLELSAKYLMDVYYAYDFELGRPSDLEVRVVRLAHEWALEFVYSFDAGEGNDHSFSVNVMPTLLLDDVRRRRERRIAEAR